MFNQKKQRRGLREAIATTLVIFARLHYLAMPLAAVLAMTSVDTAPPATQSELADDDLTGTRLLFMNRGGRHG